MGDVVSLAERRAAREPKPEAPVRPAGRMLTAIRYTPGCVERIGRTDPHVIVTYAPRGPGMPAQALVMPAQDALDLATALIAAVKGGPNHVA